MVTKTLVEVVWQDPECDAGWHSEEHEDMKVLHTYGLLMPDRAGEVRVASTYDPEADMWSERMRFPKGCVLAVNIIREVQVP